MPSFLLKQKYLSLYCASRNANDVPWERKDILYRSFPFAINDYLHLPSSSRTLLHSGISYHIGRQYAIAGR
jgi:hypothetical protein